MRSGTVAVIGRANAGKSTLINVLVGEKVAIVSPKPQTTRDRIMGVRNSDRSQIAFVDTPGIYKAANELSARMMHTAESSARDVDMLLFVHDGHRGVTAEDVRLIKKYAAFGIPMLIAYTKIDIMPESAIPADVRALGEAGVDCDVYPVSARKGKNLDKLIAAIEAALPEGEPLFPVDVLSDKSEKFMLAEIMREKILLRYDKEIPHGVAVLVNKFENGETLATVDMDIVCEKFNHKAILIGKQGSALKETLSGARREMENMLEERIHLFLFVKVRENWIDDPARYRDWGLNFNA